MPIIQRGRAGIVPMPPSGYNHLSLIKPHHRKLTTAPATPPRSDRAKRGAAATSLALAIAADPASVALTPRRLAGAAIPTATRAAGCAALAAMPPNARAAEATRLVRRACGAEWSHATTRRRRD